MNDGTSHIVFMDEAGYSVEHSKTAAVYRMMDLAKFNSLLARNAMAFSRADKFDDQWEARLTPRDWQALDAFANNFNEFSRDQWRLMTRDQKIEAVRKSIHASCWYCRPIESNLMWGSYGSQRNNGVAIRSTIKRLVSCFVEPIPLFVGKVRYMNYEEMERGSELYNRTITETDLVRYFFQKRSPFSDEREVRIIYRQWVQSNQGTPPVIYVRCNLQVLIERVHVAPHSSKWFRDDVAALLKQYGLEIPVQFSELDELPV